MYGGNIQCDEQYCGTRLILQIKCVVSLTHDVRLIWKYFLCIYYMPILLGALENLLINFLILFMSLRLYIELWL